MIASLQGEVTHIGLDSLVLAVNGVGYRVFATPATLTGVTHGSTQSLATSLVVREDSLTLFGFLTHSERDMYESLQTVSGVGPKLALAMLAVLEPDEIRRAVEAEDLPSLQRVPGVGPKSAKRLVLELQGKLGAPQESVTATAPSPGVNEEVLDALVGLGWNLRVAQKALETVAAESPNLPATPAALLRATLLNLGGK